MPRYKTVEISPSELGQEQAELFSALIIGLEKKGIKQELIESIVGNIAVAGSSYVEGCKGMDDPGALVSNPAITHRITR